MKIGIAAPVTLSLLTPHLDGQPELGDGYAFAPMARWVLGLRDRGHEVSVFTLSPNVPQAKSYAGPGLNLHVAPYRKSGRARDAFLVERQHLAELMRSYPQQVWHAHWTYEFALAALAVSRRVVVTAHDSPLDVLQHQPNIYRLMRLAMAVQVVKKAPIISAVSPYIARSFSRSFRRHDLQIVPNGVPDEVFSRTPLGHHSQKATTFASSMMGFSGRKNGRLLLEAFAIVKKHEPDAKLLMFGDEYGKNDKAEWYAHDIGLFNGIEYVGRVPYPELLRRMNEEVDIMVHPALEESFGMAIAEAMGLGIPVIAGELSGAVPWVTADGWAARLVNVRDVEAVAQAMLRLARSRIEREHLGMIARRHVYENFSQQQQLQGYEDLYRQVLNK